MTIDVTSSYGLELQTLLKAVSFSNVSYLFQK